MLAGYFVMKVTTLKGGDGPRRRLSAHEVKAQKPLVRYDIASVCNRIA